MYSLPTTQLSRKTSFFFLTTRQENDLSAKKDNTNGNRILKNDKSSGAKLDNSIKGSFFQKILCLQTIANFFVQRKEVTDNDLMQ